MCTSDPITVERAEIEAMAALVAEVRSVGEPGFEAPLFDLETRLQRMLRSSRRAAAQPAQI